ncbi:MAG: DUF5659 domain-containing protein [Candidatus Dojkabacteria bacterium]|nr:DUF5659 domain-containing protein [Candidatus Dojkabacteria bacterium]
MKTKDIWLAAALITLNFNPLAIDKEGEIIYFTFPDDKNIKTVVDNFEAGTLKINLTAFMVHYKKLLATVKTMLLTQN